MKFGKYQGTGNDFVMIEDLDDRLDLSPKAVRAICDRRFGIGADGVIRLAPGTEGGQFFMDHVNADGTTAEMCGNGIRCLAVFARDIGATTESELKVLTRSGLKIVSVNADGSVTVDMGAPIFEPSAIPVTAPGSNALELQIEAAGEVHTVACLSLGNPHAVLFVDDPDAAPVTSLGPEIETIDLFPNKANVEFAAARGPDRIEMRVWERGVGETMACGTGACAVGVAARLLKDTNESVTVTLPGGDLRIEWAGDLTTQAPVYMTGPAVKSFDGSFDDALMA